MLPKKKRLSKNDFVGLRPKKVVRGAFFDVAFTPKEATKYACVIAKKQIKSAVDRNKIKRKIYTIVGGLEHTMKGFFIIYPKKTINTLSYKRIEEEFDKLFATLQ
jgi:ribonuclease P protein component